MATKKTVSKTAAKPKASGQRRPSRSSRQATAAAAVTAADDTVAVADLTGEPGVGGETHQTASGGQPRLTTQQGVPVADDQNTLRVGERGPSLLEDFHFREKIFHFDHERIPERVVHARGFGAHGFFEPYESLSELTRADLFQRPGEHSAGVRPLLDGRRQQGLVRPRSRRPRLRRQVLHAGGELGSRRQQHPGVLHPGRDQVPRPRPLR